MSRERILVVDDDNLSREFLCEAARALGFRAESASSAEQALRRLEDETPDLVLTRKRSGVREKCGD